MSVVGRSTLLVSLILAVSAEYASYTGQNFVASVPVRLRFAATSCFLIDCMFLRLDRLRKILLRKP